MLLMEFNCVQEQERIKKKEDAMVKKEKDLTKQIEEWEQKASDLDMDLQVSLLNS